MTATLLCGHVLDVLPTLPEKSVHCVVCSPPYLGLRKYSVDPVTWPDGWTGHLGAEPTPDHFVSHLVMVFDAVRRVMRGDAVLWTNLGDSYNGSGGPGSQYDSKATWGYKGEFQKFKNANRDIPSLKPLDLIGVPWRFALAMQADGWYLRSAITWAKLNVMPESVNGWRFEKHRIKVGNNGRGKEAWRQGSNPEHPQSDHDGRDFAHDAQWTDCPGCPICLPNDGLVLRKGNWRPTKATEMIFMFSKTDSYYADREAVTVPSNGASGWARERASGKNTWVYNNTEERIKGTGQHIESSTLGNASGRNLWDYWLLPTRPLHEAHYAAFSPEIPRRCIEASTSARGVCTRCGSQYARVVERESGTTRPHSRPVGNARGVSPSDFRALGQPQQGSQIVTTSTLGWRATCTCNAGDPISATVLDPFVGSGTTCIVAAGLGRSSIGIDASEEYIAMSRRRLGLLIEENHNVSL